MNKNTNEDAIAKIVDADLIYPDKLPSEPEQTRPKLDVSQIAESEFPDIPEKKVKHFKKIRKVLRKFSHWIGASKAGAAYYKWYNKIWDAKISLKHACQRATKGWCDKDCWSFSYWFCSTAPKILRHLAEHTIGYPCSPEIRKKMDELFPDYKHDGPEDEKYFGLWKQTIHYLAYLIENSCDDTCTFINHVECPDHPFNSVKLDKKKNSDDSVDADSDDENTLYQLVRNESVWAKFEEWNKAETDIENKVRKCREEMFDLLKLLFDSLWD